MLWTYRNISETIWNGNMYRLVSPYEGNRAVVLFSNDDKSKAVLFNYNLNSRFREAFNLVRLRGLKENCNYRVQEINLFPDTKSKFPFNGKVLSGDFLMKVGLNVSGSEALSSSIFEITAQ